MIGKGNDCLFPLYVGIPGHEKEKLRTRCGKCINCKIHRSQEWCLRLEMESQYWKSLCFVTLTYDDDHLPVHIIDPHLFYTDEEIRQNPRLNYLFVPTHRRSDLCNFIKRLRKHLGYKIRYFAVGEYGTRYGRSHLHVLFFGVPFSRDTVVLLQKCWTYGFVKVTPFFPETCTYVAGYVQKKLYGKDKDFFKLPEFMRCSQHLGERWLFDHLEEFRSGKYTISWHGYEYGIPRQFRKILVREGVMKPSSVFGCALIQRQEYQELKKHLVDSGINESEFWLGRWKNAIEKERRRNNRRNITGDI